MKRKSIFWRIFALCLAVILTVPTYASAAVIIPDETQGNDYVDSYQVNITPVGGGKVKVKFSITGVDVMDDIGAIKILIYESSDLTNWDHVMTYDHRGVSYTHLMSHDRRTYSSSITHPGKAGKYYKAYIILWVQKDGSGTSKYKWLDPIRAY